MTQECQVPPLPSEPSLLSQSHLTALLIASTFSAERELRLSLSNTGICCHLTRSIVTLAVRLVLVFHHIILHVGQRSLLALSDQSTFFHIFALLSTFFFPLFHKGQICRVHELEFSFQLTLCSSCRVSMGF
ncbi:hypothetical protein XENOCAPTIV_016542 [Xenoophorus captivus]|uniref:Uncharacterized protein n=1 Tax=Xenoophorus captivus TaxID=1517983 RepID=A0ABV0RZ84_9TELE